MLTAKTLQRVRPTVYTRTQIALHWLVAALVLVQYGTSGAIMRTHAVHLIGHRPNPTDLFLHTVHNRVGLGIVVLMLGRLALRLWAGAPAPGDAARGFAVRVALIVHLAFYAVLISEGVTGAVATYLWWPISSVHLVLFKMLLALVTIDVGAAFWRELVGKDAVMRRMGFKQLLGSRNAS